MKIKLYMETEIDGKVAKIIEFCEEPNTGLCRVSYRDWAFTIPNVFAEIIFGEDARIKSHDEFMGDLLGRGGG